MVRPIQKAVDVSVAGTKSAGNKLSNRLVAIAPSTPEPQVEGRWPLTRTFLFVLITCGALWFAVYAVFKLLA